MNTENTEGMAGREFRHLEITRRIVGVFFEVYGELGYGLLESVYRVAMALREAGITVQAEMELQARFRGRSVGAFRADLLVEDAVLVELKAARGIDSAHTSRSCSTTCAAPPSRPASS